MNISLNDLNQTFELSEKYLRFASCIPVVNYFSSTARYYLGLAQVIGGVAFTIFYHISNSIINDVRQQTENTLYMHKSIEYINHGVLNIARSYAESFSFIFALALVAYDFNSSKILKYTDLTSIRA